MSVSRVAVSGGLIAAAAATGLHLAASGAARAQTPDQIAACDGRGNPTAEVRIGSCNEVIRSGRYSGRSLAIAYVNRGDGHRAKGDFNDAFADYNHAIKIDGMLALAFHQRALAHRDRRDYDRALADLDQALKINPKYAIAFSNRGIVYADKRDLDRAIENYDQAIALAPTAFRLNNRGVAHYDKRNYDRALADFDEAIKLEPNAIRLKNRGDAHQRKGELDRAIADYDEAIKLDPKLGVALAARGVAYRAKGDGARADSDYTAAIKLDPVAGAAASRLGVDAEADRLYGLAIQAGGIPDSLLADLHYRRGAVRGGLGQNGAALEDFSAAIRLKPDNGNALGLRGYLYAVMGRYDAADADFKRALDLAPSHNFPSYLPWVLSCRADLLRRQRKFDEALALIDRALRLQDYVYAHYVRAWIYFDTDRKELVKDSYERFDRLWAQQGYPDATLWPDERAVLPEFKRLAGRT
jgi:tetratricopeptide (TPR) repeat protein